MKSEPLNVEGVGDFVFELDPTFSQQLKSASIYNSIVGDLELTDTFKSVADVFSTLKVVTLQRPASFDYDKLDLKKEGASTLLKIWKVYRDTRNTSIKNAESTLENKPLKTATATPTGSDATTA